jgi:dTDP-4-dehydrorhamnose reductase
MGLIIMPNVLVTGGNGQLGSEIKDLASHSTDTFFFTNSTILDITEHKKVASFCLENKINIIINCAAYTAVDKAETEKELAEAINYQGVKNLAKIAKENSIKLIHISTDYVFDGKNKKPYNEDDITHPIGIYGKTKLAGEHAIIECNLKNSIIIRTSWLYSFYGNNFVRTMAKLGAQKKELNVIFDQIGTPTYAKDLAQAILTILPKIQNDSLEIYHYSNDGVCSWFDFATEIMQKLKLDCVIKPIETKDYPTLVTRPEYSVLNKDKIQKKFGIKIPNWKESLNECLRRF